MISAAIFGLVDLIEGELLRRFWWLLEILPHGYYDAATKKKRWRIPMGASRTIPPGSVFHESVGEKLRVDPKYKPKNLPDGWEQCTEPAVACEFK